MKYGSPDTWHSISRGLPVSTLAGAWAGAALRAEEEPTALHL